MRVVYWTTIMPVISEADVLANADAIVAAAYEFRRTAQDLMERLARRFHVRSEVFWEHPDWWVRPPPTRWWERLHARLAPRSYQRSSQRGVVAGGWSYHRHGCAFHWTSTRTGQELDVKIGFPGEFGVLDAWYFLCFLRTTPGLTQLAKLLSDTDPRGSDNVHFAIGVLREHGRLLLVTCNGRSGECAPPDQPQPVPLKG